MFWEIRSYYPRIGGFPGKLNPCGTLIVPFGKRISLGIGLGYMEMKRRGVWVVDPENILSVLYSLMHEKFKKFKEVVVNG